MKITLVALGIVFIIIFAPSVFGEERNIEILAKKFSYSPNIIRVKRGDEVTFRLISEDVTHGLHVDGYQLSTKAQPGQDGSISFVADRTGRFTFRCSVTCGEFHPFMVGYLIVGPNTRFYIYAIIASAVGLGSIFTALFVKKRKAG